MTSDPLDEWPSGQELVKLFPAAYEPHVAAKRPGAGAHLTGRKGGPLKADRPLTTKVRMVLSLEMRGQTQAEIAQRMGLKQASIARMVRTDRYIQAREVLLGRMDNDFSAMKPSAFAALRQGLNSRDENVALRASEAWMRAAGFGQYGKGNSPPGLTAEDVARQLLQVNVSVSVNENK